MDRRDYFLPQDLVADILSRLPTTDAAVRFRCVCKSWHRLLSDPNFIHRHLLSELHGGDNDEAPVIMITRLSLEETTRLRYCWLSYDTLLPKTAPYNDHEGLHYLDVPVAEIYSTGQPLLYIRQIIVGWCHGLFCITYMSWWESTTAYLILWNPSTSEAKVLPNSHYNYDTKFTTADYIGFGFDSRTGDYKVVRAFQDVTNNNLSTVKVYSLRRGSWREVNASSKEDLEKFLLATEDAWMHTSSGGKIYWYCICCNFIVCFDFREERFSLQLLPTSCFTECREFHLTTTPKEDSLVAVFLDSKDNVEIWGLLRYQSVESWTKLFRCDASRILDSIGKDHCMMSFLGNCQHIFLKANGELLKVDFKKEKVSDNGIRILNMSRDNIDHNVLEACSYVPSRVSIVRLLRRNQDCSQ